MPSKSSFRTEEAYKNYKKREYDRYYGSTQLYERRIWSSEEIELLINNFDHTARELSNMLCRSIKSVEHMRCKIRNNPGEYAVCKS